MKRLFLGLTIIICYSFVINADDFEKLFVRNGEPFILDESKELFESPGLGWIFVDKDLDIYLPDYVAKNVKKYNKTGKLIMTYGRPGKGPGEFEFPVKVIVKNEKLIVQDFSKRNFSVFDINTGEFLKSYTRSFLDIGLKLSPDGWIYTIGINSQEKDLIHRMDDEMSIKAKFFKPEILTSIIMHTSPFVHMDWDASVNIYVGIRTSYKIAVYDKNFKLKKIFGEPSENWDQLDENLTTEEEYRKIKKQYTYLIDIYVLNNKYLLAQKSLKNVEDAYNLDLYTLDGKKMFEDVLTDRIIVGRDHLSNIYVYSTRETADDMQRVLCRYRLRDDIK